MLHDGIDLEISKVADKVGKGNVASDGGPHQEIQAMKPDEQRAAHAAMTDSRIKTTNAALSALDLADHGNESQLEARPTKVPSIVAGQETARPTWEARPTKGPSIAAGQDKEPPTWEARPTKEPSIAAGQDTARPTW